MNAARAAVSAVGADAKVRLHALDAATATSNKTMIGNKNPP